MNYDTHAGNLQQSNGNILSVNRSAVYVGGGSMAVAAGTVAIPGVFLGGNTAVGIFNYLESRQLVRQREFENLAVRNQVFLKVVAGVSASCFGLKAGTPWRCRRWRSRGRSPS